MIITVLKSVLILTVLIVPSFSAPKPAPKCNQTAMEADSCGNKLLIIGGEGIHIPTNEDELTQRCDTIYDGIKCLKRYSRSCLDPFTKQIMGMIAQNSAKQADGVCKNAEVKKEIIEHLKCFMPEERLEPLRICLEKLVIHMEYFPNISSENRIPAMCCSTHELSKCVKEKSAAICTKPETVEYIENLLTSVTKEVISFGCGKYKSIEGCNENMDKQLWKELQDMVASDDHEVLKEKHKYKSPFVAITNIIKEFKF